MEDYKIVYRSLGTLCVLLCPSGLLCKYIHCQNLDSGIGPMLLIQLQTSLHFLQLLLKTYHTETFHLKSLRREAYYTASLYFPLNFF